MGSFTIWARVRPDGNGTFVATVTAVPLTSGTLSPASDVRTSACGSRDRAISERDRLAGELTIEIVERGDRLLGIETD